MLQSVDGIAHIVHSCRPVTSYNDDEAWAEVQVLMDKLNHSIVAHALVASIDSDDLSASITVQQALFSLRSIASRLPEVSLYPQKQ